MDVGRDGSVPGRAVGWIGSFFDDREVPVDVRVDELTMRATVAKLDPRRKAPVDLRDKPHRSPSASG